MCKGGNLFSAVYYSVHGSLYTKSLTAAYLEQKAADKVISSS